MESASSSQTSQQSNLSLSEENKVTFECPICKEVTPHSLRRITEKQIVAYNELRARLESKGLKIVAKIDFNQRKHCQNCSLHIDKEKQR